MSKASGGSGMPDTTIVPSGGVMGLIQQNTEEGRCLLENPSEMLTKAFFVVVDVVVFCCSCSMLGQSNCCVAVNYRQRMFYCEGGPLRTPRTPCSACCSCHQPVVCVVVSCCSGSMVGQLLYWLG